MVAQYTDNVQGIFRQVRCSAHRPLVVSPKEGSPFAIIAGVNLSPLRVLRRADLPWLSQYIFLRLDRFPPGPAA